MLHVSYDCSIITTFDVINDVPINYLHHRAGRAKTSITVPPNSSKKISCPKSFVLRFANNDKTFEFLPRIEIVNEKKDTKWTLIWLTS